jgi:mannose-6-phosphate isomerase
MQTSALYPLSFQPILKEKIWGGQKLTTILGKDTPGLSNCGESWEISGVPGNVSVVSNGSLKGKSLNELIERFGEKLMGKSVMASFGQEFPLLIKFIDAAADLSIQVHPNDELASARHGSKGKTEMWYIMQADEGASLIAGFNRETSKDAFLAYVKEGRLTEIMNTEQVKAGDVFFIPAGRIHTIGAGLLLAEIQQTSDVTYRIYDFDRTDKDGNKRELHIEEALDAMDYACYDSYKTHYDERENEVNPVISSPFFTTNKIKLTQPLTIKKATTDSFRIYICTRGRGMIEGEAIGLGETMLVPACLEEIQIIPDDEIELLETYLDSAL